MARERGVLRLWPDSSSKTSPAPRSAAVPYLRPGLLPPGGDLLLIPLGRAPGGDLHAPPQAVQQQVQPGQGVGHADRSRTTSATRASVQHWSSPSPGG